MPEPFAERLSVANAADRTVLTRILTALNRIAEGCQQRRWLALIVIVGTFLPVSIAAANNWPLTNDEIYTLRIAQQSTIQQMIAVSREIDLHPPLHYLAEREALKLPIRRDVAARFPSLLGGLAFCIALFLYTERRLGAVFGFVAVGFTWFTFLLDYTWSNRPYALWMAFLWMTILALDSARSSAKRGWGLAAVFLLAVAMVMTQILGVICLAILIVAEGVRGWRLRRFDWVLGAVLVLPCFCALYVHFQIHALSGNTFPQGQQASMGLVFGMYGEMIGNIAVIAGACVVGMFLLIGSRRSPAPSAATLRSMEPEDVALLLMFLAFPVILFFPAKIENLQFWSRYGMPVIPALSVLLAWSIARRMPWGNVTALILAMVSVGYTVSRIFSDDDPRVVARAVVGGRAPIALDKLDHSLPIVVASPMSFVEMADREPAAIADRVYYLTDYAAADQYAHYTLFENEDKIVKLLNLPTHAEPLGDFTAMHTAFYLTGEYGRPEIWLPRKLIADGWKLQYLGKYVSTYENNDLYLVSK
jgi:hypothetical protein